MNNNLLPNLIDENKVLVWSLILLNMNEVPIAVIQYENLGFTRKFDDYDELSFTIPRFLYDRFNKSTIDNKTWFTLRAGLKVRLDIFEQSGLIWKPVFSELFAIQQPTLSESRDNNSQQWSCIALHQLLFNKMKIRGYEDTRKLVEPNKVHNATSQNPYKPEKSDYSLTDNTNGGILEYVLSNILTEWSIAYYDENLLRIGQQQDLDETWVDEALDYGNSILYNWKIDSEDGGAALLNLNNFVRNFISTCTKGTQENITILLAEYQKFLQDVGMIQDIAQYNESNYRSYIAGIKEEPLKGAVLINNLENSIIGIQNWMRTLCDYTYSDDGYEDLYGTTNNRNDSILAQYKNISKSILNLIENLSLYKSATGSAPYRTLKLDTTLVDMFKQLEQSYLCVFEFDNINKQIYIYSRENKAVNNIEPLIISPHNIMEGINYQASTDQIITRLWAKGKDDITLGGYNITGLNYIDNFQYYIDNKMMSEELENALIYYKWLIEDVRIYQDMVNTGRIITQYSSITEYQAKIRELHGETDWVLTKNAEWLYENFLVPVSYYDGTKLDINTVIDIPEITTYWTIKQVQEHIVKMSNSVAALQPLARQYEIVTDSTTPTIAEYEDETSWWHNINARAAYTSAKDNALEEIEEEMNIYLSFDVSEYGTPEHGSLNRLQVMNGIWYLGVSGNADDPNTSFYLYQNAYIVLPTALINWQKQFQYENIRYELNGNTIFSQSLLNELNNFVYEDDISWSTITSADSLCLYATEYLDYICKIPLTINLDTIDILSNYRYQLDWHKITDVGAKLYVEFEDFGLHYDLIKLMSYTYNISPTDSQIQLQFSNTYELQDLLNQVIADVWAYSYKQLQDISTYKTSWENFIAKEDALILQGQQIQSDVSAIVDNAGNKVISSKGLVVSPVKYNALQHGVNGYYVRDKSLSSTKAGTKTKPGQNPQTLAANTKTIPDHIVFQDADVVYSTDSAGETTLTISNVGGGGAGGSGLPWLYAVPMLSEKIKVRLVGNTSWHVTRDGNTYVYYQEMKDNTYTWYEQQIDLTEANIISATDESGNVLYWSDNNRAVSYSGTTAVQIYAAIGAPKVVFQAYRSSTAGSEHLPIFKFGVGDGEGHGYGYLEKTIDGIKVSYYTRTGGTAPDTENRYRGIHIRDNGIYQIRGSQECYVPFVHIQSTLQDSTDIEENDWVLVDVGV